MEMSYVKEAAVWVAAIVMLAAGALVAVAVTSAPIVFSVVVGLWIAKAVGIIW
jgi:hypothetical protein